MDLLIFSGQSNMQGQTEGLPACNETVDGAYDTEEGCLSLLGGVEGGNISDLGGYYNELAYFCQKAKTGEKIEQATLCDGVSSLEFLLKELA